MPEGAAVKKEWIQKRLEQLAQQERIGTMQLHQVQGAILLCRELLEDSMTEDDLADGIERAANEQVAVEDEDGGVPV